MAKGFKTGGRMKGTPNKTTKDLNEYFDSIDFHIPEEIIKVLPNLSDSKKVETLLCLMEFIYPKRKSAEIKNENFNVLSFTEAISKIFED